MDILRLTAGGLLLIFGRRLFWLFVGIVGFFVGFEAATSLLPDTPDLLKLAIAVVAGLIFAGLGVFLQKVALAIAGFLIGGYAATTLMSIFNFEPGGLTWVFFIVGALIGVGLIFLAFDWALIILSSLAGAVIILQALQVEPAMQSIGLLGLTVVGILIQGGMLRSGTQKRQ